MDAELWKIFTAFGMAGLILGCWVWDSIRKEKIIKEVHQMFYEQSKITNDTLTTIKTIVEMKLK
jgi:hypothetical protein